jgi:lyso-ornithine lipid O-acyltransferase
MNSLPTQAVSEKLVALEPTPPLLWRLLGALWQLRAGGPEELSAKAERLRELCEWARQVHQIVVDLRGDVPRGPAIFVSNHLGYIDPVVLCSLLPVSPIAKHEISEWALVGDPLDELNVSFVRRGSAASGARVLRRCLRALRAGVSVLNFPEGTTSRGSGLLPFHLGAFWLARRTGAPIVPVGMDFEAADLCWVDSEGFLPHYVKLCLSPGPRRVRVSLAAPLDPARYRSDLDLCWAARDAIAAVRRPYACSRGDAQRRPA